MIILFFRRYVSLSHMSSICLVLLLLLVTKYFSFWYIPPECFFHVNKTSTNNYYYSLFPLKKKVNTKHSFAPTYFLLNSILKKFYVPSFLPLLYIVNRASFVSVYLCNIKCAYISPTWLVNFKGYCLIPRSSTDLLHLPSFYLLLSHFLFLCLGQCIDIKHLWSILPYYSWVLIL